MPQTLTANARVSEPFSERLDRRANAHTARIGENPIIVALLVCAAYLAGARIGFLLVLPQTTPSVLWPPNAILTTALLLTPVRRWWICLLAALPAHILIELNAGFPPELVLGLFVTNCSEALIAAAGVRALSDAPARFDTLRRVAIFVGAAALMAPFVSSFLDAALVTLTRGEQYWLVWRTRFFSNVLTELTLVPAVVSVIAYGPGWLRSASPAERAEAALLAVGLLIVGIVAFDGPADGPWALPGTPRTPIVFLLPFLLWAAVRFGSGGASLSLLTTAVILIVASVRGHGPFFDLPPGESVLAIQIFLTAMGIPFLTLAAVVGERRRAEDALGERLVFETRLSRLSAAFVHLPSHPVESAIETGLHSIADFLETDIVVTFDVSIDGQRLTSVRSWTSAGASAQPDTVISGAIAGAVGRLRDGPFVMSSERRSFLVFPLTTGTRVYGGLAFVSPAGSEWPDEQVQRLRLVGEVFATALIRNQAEIDAQRSRQELAHFARLSTIGEMTSSIAHELNHPLAGILANAQAARRMAVGTPPELREALGEIEEDTRRASEVIHRVRELVRKSEPTVLPLDINLLIRDVYRLLRSDAVIRNVLVDLALRPGPLMVNGDHVQLRQLVLNLLLNAFEALSESGDGERLVIVRTTLTEEDAVLVSIRDSGPGLREGTEEQVFEPFFTSKSGGMGMGLSIAKSIVLAHGGIIRAQNNRVRGATFQFTLALARMPQP